MAVGDDATGAGYPLVPSTGSEGLVKWGAREINRTRDFIAQVKAIWNETKAFFRGKSGLSSGTADPSGGDDGDWYAKIV